MGWTGREGEDKAEETEENGFWRSDEMKRIGLAMAALAVALTGLEVPAQETGVYRCGTGDLLVAMEREAARKAEEEAAAKAVMEKERVASLAREKKGLVLHYAFGRGGAWGAGAVVKDLSGQGHDGRVDGDGLEAVRGMGAKGRAARFDGKGDFIRAPKDPAAGAESLTVAVWVKVREGDEEGESGTIVYKRNSSFHDNEGFCLEIFPDFRLKATVANRSSRGQCVVFSSSAMAKGLWHHAAMTYEPGRACLYLDGALAGSGIVPESLDFHSEADWLVGVRDHEQYPLSRFGMFELADFRMWDEALDGERVAALYRERAGRTGVAKPEDNRAPAGDRPLFRCGEGVPADDPPRVFPPWTPGKPVGKSGAAAELRALVAQGRRDRAASPEFLAALEGLAAKWERDGGMSADARDRRVATDKLPMTEDWRGEGWPLGWEAVRRDVWRFGDGEARQVESRANTRYVLFYEPGKAWTDYTATVRFESDQWFAPPMRSSAWLYFRYHGVDDSYVVYWDGAGDVTLSSLEKERQGKERILSRTPVDRAILLDGKPWSVKVRGEEIEVWHEGKRYLFATDGAHPSGTVGVESVHIAMRFSGLEVR